MYIEKLTLKNFRNYENLELDFDSRVNLVTGRNAQGKTNLIESLYLSSIGRSFRTPRDAEMIRFGEENAYVKVKAQKELTATTVEIMLGSDSKKAVKKDGSSIRSISKLLDNIIIVIFSPEDLKIVKEEPEKRRKFIDRELSQIKPSYFESISKYKKALLERNRYLKEETPDPAMLDMWDDVLVKYGADIMQKRNGFLEELSSISSEIHQKITNGKENLALQYEPNVEVAASAEEQEAKIRKALQNARERDVRFRSTSRGPHKDDFSFLIDGVNVRNYGSQGQQRTSALSLKLAELELIKREAGENAILLLDDVMSELDEERREYLIRAFSENQIFITCTDIDESLMRAYPEAKIIRVENGRIS